MEAHPEAAAVQAAACRMLANLTNGDIACKHAALDAGALRAVTATMARLGLGLGLGLGVRVRARDGFDQPWS